jgi:hypothetical protein
MMKSNLDLVPHIPVIQMIVVHHVMKTASLRFLVNIVRKTSALMLISSAMSDVIRANVPTRVNIAPNLSVKVHICSVIY